MHKGLRACGEEKLCSTSILWASYKLLTSVATFRPKKSLPISPWFRLGAVAQVYSYQIMCWTSLWKPITSTEQNAYTHKKLISVQPMLLCTNSVLSKIIKAVDTRMCVPGPNELGSLFWSSRSKRLWTLSSYGLSKMKPVFEIEAVNNTRMYVPGSNELLQPRVFSIWRDSGPL